MIAHMRVSARSGSALACCAIAGLALAPGAAGEGRPPGRDDPAARRLAQRAADLVNRASHEVATRDPGCRVTFAPAPPSVAERGAGPEVTALLGAFRRAPSPADRAAADLLLAAPPPNPFFAEIPRDGIRLVHAADGTPVTLVAATRLRTLGLPPEARLGCQAATRDALARLARGAPTLVAEQAARDLRQVEREERPPAVAPTEGLETMVGGGGGGGPIDPARFAAHPPGVAGQGRHGTRLTLVLPDGVTSADLTFSRWSSPTPARHPIDHRHTLRITVRVVENVLSVRVPGRAPEDALAAVVVERARDGSVIRTVRLPG
jgi:hypothetical protein